MEELVDILNTEGDERHIERVIEVKRGENVELSTLMVLAAPHTKGDTLIKAVVYDGGRLKLKGMVKVSKGAVGADGFLRQKVLLVGKTAMAEATPELEIECNEVKASHAASIGRIDEEQMFYLMSRGFEKEDAVKLIIEAFLK